MNIFNFFCVLFFFIAATFPRVGIGEGISVFSFKEQNELLDTSAKSLEMFEQQLQWLCSDLDKFVNMYENDLKKEGVFQDTIKRHSQIKKR